jgi:hydroxymethylpyrimidine/phosphomethylpyrimidine kinase
MINVLYFLHGNADDEAKEFFYNQLRKVLSDLIREEIKIGTIENSFLLENKYISMYTVKFEDKDIMNEMMVSGKGKELNRTIMNFHNFITIIVVNY